MCAVSSRCLVFLVYLVQFAGHTEPHVSNTDHSFSPNQGVGEVLVGNCNYSAANAVTYFVNLLALRGWSNRWHPLQL